MELARDLRFAIRDLGHAPGYALVAVCTLAVAIGASTAVFSVVDKVLLRPLPIDEPDRVVVIWTRDDERGVERVAVMSHGTWVRRFAADPAVIGRPLRSDNGVYTIVGVMPPGFDYPKGAELWVPLVPPIAPTGDQTGVDLLVDTGIGFLYVLGRLNAGITTDAARDEVAGLLAQNRDFIPAQYHAVLTDQLVGRAVAPWRFSASTLGLLAVLALSLASLGVYAIVTQSVQERRREIGVRVAVGALPRQIAGLVLRDILSLTAVGIAGGLAVGTGAGHALSSLLYEVQPADPLTLSAMTALFFTASTTAVLMPVWRATRVDPVQVLRQQ